MVCFHYYSFTFYASWGLQFYSQNSWFSDIIFEHRNNFLSNTGRWTGSRDFFRLFRSKKFDSEIVSGVFLKFFFLLSLDRWYIIRALVFFRWFSCLLCSVFFCYPVSWCCVTSSPTTAQREFGFRLFFSINFSFCHIFSPRFSRSPMTENEKSYFKSPSFVFRGFKRVRQALPKIDTPFIRRGEKMLAMTRRYFCASSRWVDGKASRSGFYGVYEISSARLDIRFFRLLEIFRQRKLDGSV